MLIFKNLGDELVYCLLITLSTLHLSFVLHLIILSEYAICTERMLYADDCHNIEFSFCHYSQIIQPLCAGHVTFSCHYTEAVYLLCPIVASPFSLCATTETFSPLSPNVTSLFSLCPSITVHLAPLSHCARRFFVLSFLTAALKTGNIGIHPSRAC